MPRIRTVALATLVGVTGLIAFAPAASAHVTVSSTDAKQGGYGVITFRVPNEEAAANTTKLQVQLPTDTPFAFAATQPIPGWTAVATKTKLPKPITTDDGQITEGVTQITWTATSAAAIKPGEFQLFNVEVGPLPEKDSVTLPAIQTYSNGEVVKWIEVAAAGAAEPDKPAPVLNIAAASSPSDASSGPSASVTAEQPASSDDSSSNTGPVVLSIVALVIAVGALGLAFVGRARRSA